MQEREREQQRQYVQARDVNEGLPLEREVTPPARATGMPPTVEIQEESQRMFDALSHEERLAAREELLAEMDPALVQLFEQRRQKSVSSSSGAAQGRSEVGTRKNGLPARARSLLPDQIREQWVSLHPCIPEILAMGP